ncbi:gliding motility-associated C-terminal domain-containing protein [Flavobacteriales bacterium]|nr:gliding motility-associated C-terminal domain-containing protein [Flavobacteriales bacterium]
MKPLLIFLLLATNLSAQTTDWVKSFGGAASDKGISIGTDSLGFIYISGYYNNEATFGGITLTNQNLSTNGNNKENFIAKLDSTGDIIWAIPGGNQSGGCCDDRALGMHVTPGGDVFITGTFWSSYYLGVRGATGTLNVPGSQTNSGDNSVLAKIDTDGNPEWVIGFGSNWGDDHSYDVKVDADGFIYVTGFFIGETAEFDGITLQNPNWNPPWDPKGYVGKLDPDGNWLWVEKFDGIKDFRGSRDNRLAIDQSSNIYVVGGFENTGTYGPFTITSNGEWDAFVFKMDTDGNWLWAEGIGSNKTDRANSIAVDVCDDVYICGEYRNPMVFPGANASNGSDTLSHKQKRDIFVAKMNNQGEWKWAKRARGPGTDKPYQMSVDANKQVFLGGTTKDTLVFSSSLSVAPQIAGDTTASSWVAQLDGSTSTGDWVWAKLAGADTDDDDRTGDICADGFGNVYAVGFYEDAANFDGIVLNSLGRKDIFVWKMSMTTMPPFTYNNSFDTIISPDSMVFNPADTGIFTTSSLIIDGCDTTFVDSVVYQRLGVQINYNINNIGSAVVTINGTVQAMPYSMNYWAGETVTVSAAMQPNWLFNQWTSYSNTLLPNISTTNISFVANASDSCVLMTYPQPPLKAFISGNDSICSNDAAQAQVLVSFSGATEPYTFVYSINGVNQASITTTLNPHVINTSQAGTYLLSSFSDANEIGYVSGSGLVTVKESPEAIFTTVTDTLSLLYPVVQLNDVSVGSVQMWEWNFGDNTTNSYEQNASHSYADSIGIYEISLIVTDGLGCSDTTSKQIWVSDEYWMYIPNAFTPDRDGVNDLFCLQYNGVRIETFTFNIYDRFSNLVYVTDNIEEIECFLNSNGWDGTHYETGNDLPMGQYVYEMYFQDYEGWKHQTQGYLLIVR